MHLRLGRNFKYTKNIDQEKFTWLLEFVLAASLAESQLLLGL